VCHSLCSIRRKCHQINNRRTGMEKDTSGVKEMESLLHERKGTWDGDGPSQEERFGGTITSVNIFAPFLTLET